MRTIFDPSIVGELESMHETVSEVSFSSLSYTLVLTTQGRVFEMGFSAKSDCTNQQFMSSTERQTKHFVRTLPQLDPHIILKVFSGRLSVAFTYESIFVWDCLKDNSFSVINLHAMAISSIF